MKMMMFRGLFALHLISISAGISCDETLGLAGKLRDQVTATCLLDRSQCSSLDCGDCVDGSDSYLGSCQDGCSYTLNGLTVQRTFDATQYMTYIGTSPLPLPFFQVGFTNKFLQGGEGSISFAYEATADIDSNNNQVNLRPFSVGSCYYFFNLNNCICEQRICNHDPNVFGSYIDCTQYEGGGVIDYCSALLANSSSSLLTAESTLHEVLHWLPDIACASPGEETPASTKATNTDSSAACHQHVFLNYNTSAQIICGLLFYYLL